MAAHYSLDDLRYFCTIVKLGSFKKASADLGMSLSTLSRRIRLLEQALQLTLLNRDAHRVTLTHTGELYYDRYRKLFDEVECIEQALCDEKDQPKGKIRISAPIYMGKHFLSTIFCDFLLQYPEIQLDLRFSNNLIDIEKEGIDIAFRVRNPAIDNWVIRELKLTHNILCTHLNHDYQSITHPKQLEDHPKVTCVGLVPWQLKNQQTSEEYSFNPNTHVRLEVDEIQMMKQAVESGVGISYIPDYIALPLIKAGKLKHILPDWQSKGQPFSMLYRDRKQIPYRVRLLIEHTLQHFTKM
ncbi:LysR family transcriptional regulator [Pseudoalteromonas sp. SWXJ133]|uniref:LysR family transcriptional regulator n=1 Tax=unclassified Pseudoalteromonas TaxID=194690 RepID=UPI0018CCC30E|nr:MULTISPECIES: LysR family transcriptional regulator [unclassified Pseudoalteromonas]MBH0022462.1 LysR family transcriptional regulator [Pseudoalteromonas sp. SWXJ133]MBH0077013.1 LysR family transcriptional regulator [Pseudoalteromonas sp. SWYJ118]